MIFTQTSKSKKSSKGSPYLFYNFGIPAGFAANGFNTCPSKGLCARGCYANQGFYVMKGAKKRLEDSLAAIKKTFYFIKETNKALKLIEKELAFFIKNLSSQKEVAIRIHDSGDFYSEEYILAWFTIIALNLRIQFYAYTKRVEIFKPLAKHFAIPENFKIIYSYGGKFDALINPDVDRHACVFEKGTDIEAQGYADASDDNSVAFLSKNNRIGLRYHGNQFGKEWETGAK